MPPEVVAVEGLREFQQRLKKLDGQSQKQIRLVLNDAGELIVTRARAVVPRRSGRAAASIKAQSTQREARVKAGGARVPWYPFIEFGGAVGRNNSVRRTYVPSGRFLYPTMASNRSVIVQRMAAGLDRAIREAGL